MSQPRKLDTVMVVIIYFTLFVLPSKEEWNHMQGSKFWVVNPLVFSGSPSVWLGGRRSRTDVCTWDLPHACQFVMWRASTCFFSLSLSLWCTSYCFPHSDQISVLFWMLQISYPGHITQLRKWWSLDSVCSILAFITSILLTQTVILCCCFFY
jgi:hypothetical protein